MRRQAGRSAGLRLGLGSKGTHISPLRTAIVGLCLLLAVTALPAGADGHVDAQRARDALREQRTAAAAGVDVLRASQAEVEAALDALEANAAAEQARLDDANRRVEQRSAEASAATAEATRMEGEVVQLRAAVQALAVDEFVRGTATAGDATLVLGADDAGEAAKLVFLAGLEVGRQDQVVGELSQLAEDLALQRQAAERAEAMAVEERAAAVGRVGAVEQARDAQATFVAEVETELERTLAEAAALEQLDQAFAAEIVRGERALAGRLAAEAAARTRKEQEEAAASRANARRVTPAPSAGQPARRLAPRADSPRPISAGGGTASVRGIVVDRSIAGDLADLLDAADADGVSLGGSGYRDSSQQRRLRAQNCPDPVSSPASSCRPPTARPGQSLHEQGLAIDFTYNGGLISSRSNPGFAWLAANAGRYGLSNLPSEPWHWSTTGS